MFEKLRDLGDSVSYGGEIVGEITMITSAYLVISGKTDEGVILWSVTEDIASLDAAGIEYDHENGYWDFSRYSG